MVCNNFLHSGERIVTISHAVEKYSVVGSFNPYETYQSNWFISPGRGGNNFFLKPPPSIDLVRFFLSHLPHIGSKLEDEIVVTTPLEMRIVFPVSGWDPTRGICYRMFFFKELGNSNRRSSYFMIFHCWVLNCFGSWDWMHLEDSKMIWHNLTLGYLTPAKFLPTAPEVTDVLIVLGVQISLWNWLQNCSIIPRNFGLFWGYCWRILNFTIGVDAS